MTIVKTTVIKGRVVAKGDKCWGVTSTPYYDEGWVDAGGNIKISTVCSGTGHNYLTKPSDSTYTNSPDIDELNKGRVVSVTRIVRTIVHDAIEESVEDD